MENNPLNFVYEPMAGESIDHASREAIIIAQKRNSPVEFVFNGIRIIATRDSKAEDLIDAFHDGMEKAAEEYRKTPEYAAQQERRTIEIETKKYEIHKLLIELGPLLKGAFRDAAINSSLKNKIPSNPMKFLDSFLDWLYKFTQLADDIGVSSEYNPFELAQKLEAVGYIDCEGVGQDPSYFNTKEKMGRYIIGQVINCMKKGMPPHPMTCSFIEKYRELGNEK